MTASIPVIVVGPIPLIYTRPPALSNPDPRIESLSHTKMTECAIRFWKNVVPVAYVMVRVVYSAATSLAINHPHCRNQVTNIRRLSEYKAVPAPGHPDAVETIRRPMLCPAQKSIKSMTFIVTNISKRVTPSWTHSLEPSRLRWRVIYFRSTVK